MSVIFIGYLLESFYPLSVVLHAVVHLVVLQACHQISQILHVGTSVIFVLTYFLVLVLVFEIFFSFSFVLVFIIFSF